MSKVVLISPPYMKLSYPSYDIPLALAKGCDYMNPGLLICASVFNANNVSNKIVRVNDIDEEYVKSIIDSDTILVGISCTCAWEYLESIKIAEIIKKYHNDIKIVISGWQIKSIKDKVFDDTLAIDYAILGDAEYTILNLYNNIVLSRSEQIFSVIERGKAYSDGIIKPPIINFPIIDFKDFPDYENYMPYVEESRNCPFSCQFCLNSCVNDRYQNVPYDIFVKNVELLEKRYGETSFANLLAANFGVNYQETKRKLEYLKTKQLRWNIELHVDNPWEYYVDDLKAAGICKVSIGFESGSPRILRLMNKSSKPDKYLSRLENLLSRLNEQSIKPSLNLLFDYRDDYDSMCETLAFLQRNKHRINKVKANFMFVFDGLLDKIDFSMHPNIIIDEYGAQIHAYPILPKNISLEEMSHIIDEIEKGNFDQSILLSTSFSSSKVRNFHI